MALLLTAANAAYVGGDLNAAIALLRRALAEPPDSPLRAAVLGRLGQMEALAHDPACVEHLGEALAISETPAARVAVATTLGEVLVWGGGRSIEAYEMLSRVLAELGPGLDPRLRATLETLRSRRRRSMRGWLREVVSSATICSRWPKLQGRRGAR